MAQARQRPPGRKTPQRGIGGSPVVPDEILNTGVKPTLGERLAELRDRFKMGSHHKMERFGILLGATVVGLVLVTGASYSNYHAKMTNVETTTALVSTDFSFSKTGQGGKVVGVFGDEGHKDVFVLFQLDDPKSMSTAAKNYQVFITGEKENLEPEMIPTGEFALFGSTGYGYIRFEDKQGLENGALRVTIRANEKLAADNGPATETFDASDAKYDQGTFLVNPGAKQLTPSTLALGESDPSKLYRALVGQAADDAVRVKITESTTKMASLLNRSKEYENRIRSAGYIPPAIPKFVQGDYVENEVLHTASDVFNAHKVDYASTTLADGYVKQVTSDEASFDGYMAAWRERELVNTTITSETIKAPDGVKNKTGEKMRFETVIDGESPSAQVGVKTATMDLFQVYQDYLTEKRKIQREYAYDLLVIDADVQSQNATFSRVTSTKKHIFFY